LIHGAVTVKQHGERAADFGHPLLQGGERSEGNDKDAGVASGKFVLVRAQLCGMFAAGYSTQVTQEHQQNVVPVFQDFAEVDLLTFNALQGEIGGK